MAIEQGGLAESDIKQIIATGVNAEMTSHATGKVSMVRAMAKAGTYLFPKARTVIDVGAEDARAVKCDDKGNIADFVANDRCAAGAGAFIEAIAEMLPREAMERLRTAVQEVVGQPLRVCVKLESGRAGVVRGSELRARFEEDPIVRAMLEKFGGQISKVKRPGEE